MHHRQNNFDLVRVLAALFVLVSHQHALNGLPEPTFLNLHTIGGLGVLIFFSISGFLVAQSWHADPHALRFAAKRLLRIWPGLAVAVSLLALVLGPFISTLSLHDYYQHPLVKDYFNNLLFKLRDQLPLRFEGNALPVAINGPLWTIPLEIKCYLLLGVLGVTGLLRVRWIVLGLTLFVIGIYGVWEPRGDRLAELGGWTVEQHFLLEFGLFFFAGASFFAFRVHENFRKSLAVLASCWMLAAVALACARPLLALWLVLPVTVLVIGNASTPYLRRAGRFGDLSYGLYIYAFPVQQTLIWLFKDRLSWWSVLGLTLAVTFTLAFASWHLVEKWALRLKPSQRGSGLKANSGTASVAGASSASGS